VARDEMSAKVEEFGQVFYAPRSLAYVGLANESNAATSQSSAAKYATMPAITSLVELVLGDVIAFQVMELDPATWSPAVSDYTEIIITAIDGGIVEGKLNNEKKGSLSPDLVAHSFSDLIHARLVYRRPGSSISLPQPPKAAPQTKAITPIQVPKATTPIQAPKPKVASTATPKTKVSQVTTPVFFHSSSLLTYHRSHPFEPISPPGSFGQPSRPFGTRRRHHSP
jgi:hypothetical protein